MMRRAWKRWNNSEGQIAVFLALIFQVLFVFFAMSVNVAMIVFQKINLQNSVDLAAYYGAMKQAQVLNTIGHLNYQLRQNWKLTTWRYRVLGDFGRMQPIPHPGNGSHNPNKMNETDTAYMPNPPNEDYLPAVCVAHDGFITTQSGETQCKEQGAYTIPVFRPPIVTFDPFGFGILTQRFFINAIRTIDASCGNSSRYNWLYGATMFFVFRQAQRDRRAWIEALAQSLSAEREDFIDIDGDRASNGIQATLRNNLSESNRSGVANIQILNSLAMGPNRNWRDWLQPIPITLQGQYTWSLSRSGACDKGVRPLVDVPDNERQQAIQILGGDAGLAQAIYQAVQDGPMQTYLDNQAINVIGYEKNPWMPAYVAVSAEARPLRLFTPFGTEVVLRARGVAQPFGGRIGPWYYRTWRRGSFRSTGLPGAEVDRLVPVHGADINAALNSADPRLGLRLVPNYSRFPDDPLGLRSRRALSMIGGGNPYGSKIDPLHVINVVREYDDNSKPRDPLSWNRDNPTQPPLLREDELASINPDLFDAMYYSVDANYMLATWPKLNSRWLLGQPELFGGAPRPPMAPPADLGTHFETGGIQVVGGGINERITQRVADPNFVQRYQRMYWHITDWRHLLTGWVSAREGNYEDFPTLFFAQCTNPAPGRPNLVQPQIYSGCAQGGRTGYSVKMVSRDFLNGNHSLSGEAGGNAQPLLNPPGNWPLN